MLGWKHAYKIFGWKRYGHYCTKGGPSTVYGLFKAKNVIDRDVRKQKWMKMRPIAPGINHPMKRMMHLAGRAWHFISCNVPGEHFVMRNTLEVPGFLTEAAAYLRDKPGNLRVVLRDIEGCFPNMPTQAIDQACKDITTQLRSMGHEGVYVPRRGKKKR